MEKSCIDYVIKMRREFHKFPEVSFKEYETSKRIKKELEDMGIPYKVIGGTGVVAEIKGGKPGKTIALRADIDALQVTEENEVPYASQVKGVMHACGHDGHAAMLLGAAKILSEIKDELKGNIKLLFQPTEELGAGAKKLIEEGAMQGVDRFFGMHLWEELETGKISIDAGPKMAAVGVLKIDIIGKSGHGSLPHQGVDAIVVGSAIVQNLQSIVSRQLDPMTPAVLSIGTFNAGTKFNIIAGKASLEGTTRIFDSYLIEELPKKIKRCAEKIADSYGAQVTVEHNWATKVVENHPVVSNEIAKIVEKRWGENALTSCNKTTIGEDASFFMEKAGKYFCFRRS